MTVQGTEEWHMERIGRVTASRVADVMMKPDSAGYQNYLAQLVVERLTGRPTETFSSAAMQHGTDTEPQARAYYEMLSGKDVLEVGFVHHPTLFAGASPDGLIGPDGGLELKCPQPAKHIKNIMGGTIDKQYILQMQWGMACTERKWWDYCSFSPVFPDRLRLHVQRVTADAHLISEVTAAVRLFLDAVEKQVDALSRRL